MTMASSGSDNLRGRLCRLTRDRQGATAIEYGLIAALLGVAITASLPMLKGSIAVTFLQAQVYLNLFTTR